jgi:serine/threonine protein phosphatase PrpC
MQQARNNVVVSAGAATARGTKHRVNQDRRGARELLRLAASRVHTEHKAGAVVVSLHVGVVKQAHRRCHAPGRHVCDEASEALGRYFAVFDGHGPGGEGAAAFAARNLRRLVEARAARSLASSSSASASSQQGDDDETRVLQALTRALKAGFKDCELELARQAHAPAVDARGGAVALVACVKTLPRRGDAALLVAWAGDARALLRRGGVTHRCAPERGRTP